MRSARALKIIAYSEMLHECGAAEALPEGLRARAEQAVQLGPDLSETDLFDAIGAISRAGPPEFALQFGSRRRLVDMGMFGHAILSCPTLMHALILTMNTQARMGEPFTFRSAIREGCLFYDFTPVPLARPEEARFLAEEWAAAFEAFSYESARLDCADAVIEFSHSSRAGVDYARHLRAAVRFDCPGNRIILPAEILDLPILSRDEDLCRLIVDHLTTSRPAPDHTSVAGRLWTLFARNTRNPPALAEAARQLGMSKRTLNRRLAAEQTSYSALLARFRCEYVYRLIQEGNLGAKQIALTVGYDNHQSLRRAVRQWTGAPLGALRRTQPAH